MPYLLSLTPVHAIWAAALAATISGVVMVERIVSAARVRWHFDPSPIRYSPVAVAVRSANDMERVRQLLDSHARHRHAHQRPPLQQ